MKKDLKQYLDRLSKQDDQDAFKAIFDQYFERLLNFSISYVKQHAAAEDILSDVFLKLWEGREKLTQIENFDAYLFTIVKNRSLNYLEKKKRRIDLFLEKGAHYMELTDHYTPESNYEFEELNLLFDETIKGLPGQCKRVFELVRNQKLKYKEVAAILDISTKTVDAHLTKAIKRLRQSFNDFHAGKKS